MSNRNLVVPGEFLVLTANTASHAPIAVLCENSIPLFKRVRAAVTSEPRTTAVKATDRQFAITLPVVISPLAGFLSARLNQAEFLALVIVGESFLSLCFKVFGAPLFSVFFPADFANASPFLSGMTSLAEPLGLLPISFNAADLARSASLASVALRADGIPFPINESFSVLRILLSALGPLFALGRVLALCIVARESTNASALGALRVERLWMTFSTDGFCFNWHTPIIACSP